MKGTFMSHRGPQRREEGMAGGSIVPQVGSRGTGSRADVIDYEIHGHEMQFVEIELDPGESAVAEAPWMSSGAR